MESSKRYKSASQDVSGTQNVVKGDNKVKENIFTLNNTLYSSPEDLSLVEKKTTMTCTISGGTTFTSWRQGKSQNNFRLKFNSQLAFVDARSSYIRLSIFLPSTTVEWGNNTYATLGNGIFDIIQNVRFFNKQNENIFTLNNAAKYYRQVLPQQYGQDAIIPLTGPQPSGIKQKFNGLYLFKQNTKLDFVIPLHMIHPIFDTENLLPYSICNQSYLEIDFHSPAQTFILINPQNNVITGLEDYFLNPPDLTDSNINPIYEEDIIDYGVVFLDMKLESIFFERGYENAINLRCQDRNTTMYLKYKDYHISPFSNQMKITYNDSGKKMSGPSGLPGERWDGVNFILPLAPSSNAGLWQDVDLSFAASEIHKAGFLFPPSTKGNREMYTKYVGAECTNLAVGVATISFPIAQLVFPSGPITGVIYLDQQGGKSVRYVYSEPIIYNPTTDALEVNINNFSLLLEVGKKYDFFIPSVDEASKLEKTEIDGFPLRYQFEWVRHFHNFFECFFYSHGDMGSIANVIENRDSGDAYAKQSFVKGVRVNLNEQSNTLHNLNTEANAMEVLYMQNMLYGNHLTLQSHSSLFNSGGDHNFASQIFDIGHSIHSLSVNYAKMKRMNRRMSGITVDFNTPIRFNMKVVTPVYNHYLMSQTWETNFLACVMYYQGFAPIWMQYLEYTGLTIINQPKNAPSSFDDSIWDYRKTLNILK